MESFNDLNLENIQIGTSNREAKQVNDLYNSNLKV